MMGRRTFAAPLLSVLLLVSTAHPVSAVSEPRFVTVPPTTARQGTQITIHVTVIDFAQGAAFTVSGEGVTPLVPHGGVKPARGENEFRIKFDVSPTAPPGPRNLTVTNPDGGSDTWLNAVAVVPGSGTVTGRVFLDVDGNGIEDGTDTGLAGVMVEGHSGSKPAVTTSSRADGTFDLVLDSGAITIVTTAPAGHVDTTSSSVQSLSLVTGQIVAAAAVGFTPTPWGSVFGHAFLDVDTNGREDGTDSPMAGVSVTVASASQLFSTTTDIAGNYSIDFVPTGDVTVTLAHSTSVTTENAAQAVTVSAGVATQVAAVGFAPPTNPPPVIVSVDNLNTTIQRGRSKVFQVTVLNYQAGATWTLSNPGLTVTGVTIVSGKIRLTIAAAIGAALGPADLTVTLPDGQRSTLVGAIQVV